MSTRIIIALNLICIPATAFGWGVTMQGPAGDFWTSTGWFMLPFSIVGLAGLASGPLAKKLAHRAAEKA